MKKSLFTSLGVAAVGVVAGGMLFGAASNVSASNLNGTGSGEGQGYKGAMSETMNGLLGVTQEEMTVLHDEGTSREDLILEKGYGSTEAFREAVRAELEANGDLSQRKAQMLLDGEGPHGNENGARVGR